MSNIDENWIVQFMDKAETHEQWLAMMNFGMNQLLQRQSLLAELITREAQRLAEQIPNHKASDQVGFILQELGLKLVVG